MKINALLEPLQLVFIFFVKLNAPFSINSVLTTQLTYYDWHLIEETLQSIFFPFWPLLMCADTLLIVQIPENNIVDPGEHTPLSGSIY